MIKDKIRRLAADNHNAIVACRRHLHANPELSYKEVETGKYIANQMQEIGIPFEHGMADNGVVGLIKGKNPDKKVIALRADMDALPILEANNVPYKSKNEGVMHACGHDAHTASLIGTARILHALKDEFEGTIKLIFQPAEERFPGGASIMIKEGVLNNPAPVNIFGQHVHPPLEAGKIGLKGGIYMASADELYVTVTGRGGHGALPQDCIDPVVIAAHLITAIQQLVSRQSDPTMPTVVSFGKVIANGATNVIPNEVKMEGTFRTFDENWRNEAHKRMVKLATSIAESMGGKCDFFIKRGYPFLFNNEALAAKVKERAIAYLGRENVVDLPIRMTAEDFSYFSHEIPGVFYRLGTGNVEKGITSPVHTNTFDIDESSLELSTGLMAWLALQELEN
ncbi:MAG: M20 family metallopeptidase [Bacteroidota bacterium]